MKIAIINYGYGNLHSVNQAFQKANKDFDLDAKIEVTNKPNEIDTADKIVLPGVGSFFDCLSAVKSLDGILESLQDQVINKQKKSISDYNGKKLMIVTYLEGRAKKALTPENCKSVGIEVASRGSLPSPQLVVSSASEYPSPSSSVSALFPIPSMSVSTA